MVINRTYNEQNTFDFEFINDGKVLSIYQSEQNIYLCCRYSNYKNIENISFNISNEEEIIYNIFNKLYTDIVEKNICEKPTQLDNEMYKKIVKNGIIIIYCDSYSLENPNILKISKSNNEIRLQFHKIDGKNTFKAAHSVCINIDMQNSRIANFCIPFNIMFQNLQNIEIKNEKVLIRK